MGGVYLCGDFCTSLLYIQLLRLDIGILCSQRVFGRFCACRLGSLNYDYIYLQYEQTIRVHTYISTKLYNQNHIEQFWGF